MTESAALTPFELLESIAQRMRERVAPLPEEPSQAKDWKGIAFRLREWHLVAEQGLVREVFVPARITRVPGTHPWLIGVANIHGNALPVVDLADFFWGERLSDSASNRILLVRQDDRECGVLVSEVMGVYPFLPKDVSPVSHSFPAELGDYLSGCRHHEGNVWGEFSMQLLMESPGIIDLSL